MPAKRPRISSARKSKKPLSAEKPALSSRRSFIKGAGAAVASAMLLQRAIADSWIDLVQMDEGAASSSSSGCSCSGSGSDSDSIDTSIFNTQACPLWCWATVAANLGNYYNGPDSWETCAVVTGTLNSNNAASLALCDNPPSAAHPPDDCCSSGHDGNPTCDTEASGPCNVERISTLHQ